MTAPALSIRLSADERRHAFDAAEMDLMDRQRIPIATKDWKRIEAFLARQCGRGGSPDCRFYARFGVEDLAADLRTSRA